MKCLQVFAVLLSVMVLVGCNPLKSTSKLELVSVIQLEEPCVRQGGLCVKLEDCPAASLVQIRGILCPNQRHLNVECCYQ